jgi:hypothetical protein
VTDVRFTVNMRWQELIGVRARAVAMMHKSSSLMLGEEEGVSRNLTGHSSRRQSDVFISNRKRKGHCPFRKGKGVCEAALGSRTEGRPEDAMARWCAIAAGGRSRAAFGLTRDGRQQVGPNGCLDRMLLWRSNRLPK